MKAVIHFSRIGKPDALYIEDLLLDLWVFPDGRHVELDWDEFEAAARDGLITPDQQKIAIETLQRMVAETQSGLFPARYIT